MLDRRDSSSPDNYEIHICRGVQIGTGFPMVQWVKNSTAMQEIQEIWVWSLGWEDPLEKGMATHSSILAWRTIGAEKPCGLQSLWSQRLRQNWSHWAHSQRTHQVVPVVKNTSANLGDLHSTPGWGRSPREGNGNPLQYSCQENSMNRRTWWASVHGFTKSRHNWGTNTHAHTHSLFLVSVQNISHYATKILCQPH